MERQDLYLLNGFVIPEGLYFEILQYADDNFIPYICNKVAEKMTLPKVFRISHNLQIETFNFAKFLIDLYERKKLYFKKCCDHEIL